MSMSDCPKCWSTPCDCGWAYKDYSIKKLGAFIKGILMYQTRDEAVAVLQNVMERIDDIDE